MSREQEHVLNACFLPRLQEPLCTTVRWAEKPKRIRDAQRLILRYGRRMVRVHEIEARLAQPAKIGRARIVEERLAGSEPAPHPSRSYLRIGAEAESRHEHH